VKVLVTGASGLLGRGVAEALIARGDDVTVVQRGDSGLACAQVRGDLGDPATGRLAVSGHDAVVHLAAKVSFAGAWAEFVRINVNGTRALVAAAREAGVRRFVHISSPSVAHSGRPLVGEGAGPADPVAARGSYARSKAMAEIAALQASDAVMPIVAIRPHLVWGPGDTQLVGRIVERAAAGRLALIDGGQALIDTTYATNAVDAIVAALDRCDRLGGRAFVVSNGEPRTVAELIARICAAADVPAPHLDVPYPIARAAGSVIERVWTRLGRTDEPPMTSFLAEQLATAHWFDQRETRAALDWRPAVTLDEGFARLADSYATR
jgi:nucleoside-diphosphate-sugar epimerase